MEAAAGKPFLDLIAAEVRAPFGLDSLAGDDPMAIVPARATGYSNARDAGLVSRGAAELWYAGRTEPWSNMPWFNPAYCWAGGGLLMTAPDMARFGAAHLASPHSPVTAAERALLFTPMTEKTDAMPPLGLGWRIDTDGKGRRRYHHAGSTLGGRAIDVSSSTVKFGLVWWPNIFAVRLVGNERTVTLYLCTASM